MVCEDETCVVTDVDDGTTALDGTVLSGLTSILLGITVEIGDEPLVSLVAS